MPRRSNDLDASRVSPDFALPIQVEAAHIDGLGHASNIAYVRWVQDAATSHSAAVGWTFDAYQRAGGVFVVRRHELDYLAPSMLGDELVATTFVASFSAVTSVRRTRIVRVADEVEVLRAVTTWAFVSLSGRPSRIPRELREAFESHELTVVRASDHVGAR
jgi:acyl-CoA thioester hydrolase